MKKSIKILIGIVIVIICWVAIFVVDYNRVVNLNPPIFVISKNNNADITEYKCLGYNVKAEGNEAQITKTEMYMFNKLVVAAITDVNKNVSDNNAEEYSFFAKVIESKQKYIIVEPAENTRERQSSDKISIGLGENNDALYEVGTIVKITYDGMIMESYPAQIKATKIEIKSADDFYLIFNARKDLGVKTILAKNEMKEYSYNIYSYGGEVRIFIDNKEYDLRDALLNKKITMKEIIAKANKDFPNAVSYDDGGSMEYHYDDYTILKYHKLDGNRDVYIGVPYMTINSFKNR